MIPEGLRLVRTPRAFQIGAHCQTHACVRSTYRVNCQKIFRLSMHFSNRPSHRITVNEGSQTCVATLPLSISPPDFVIGTSRLIPDAKINTAGLIHS
ncbi:hypothetical protein M404DRAFT_828399 [Pisolithus tinctorius Marx 270]|uniref:Uncharacterized protein n=1 Tax=Pisolithus tinctorius Marx 270 TaxID=870435 RepID=A0A0C3IPC3_PISTI|nr:hypothetical protein M404DRAFT_828399 [Pisolithus tinctorius Marx 270]